MSLPVPHPPPPQPPRQYFINDRSTDNAPRRRTPNIAFRSMPTIMDKDDIYYHLLHRRICYHFEILGCSPEEVDQLEQSLPFKLPLSYKEFLLCCGHEAGMFFRGTDIFFKDLDGVQGVLDELLKEINFILPPDAFVFSMHQGYEFHYFIASDGDDPPVFSYTDNGKGVPPVKVAESFSAFLKHWIEYHEEK